MTTAHNRLNAPTRLDHNAYSIDDPLSRIGEDEANFPDLLSLKDAHNLAKGPDDNVNHAGMLVSEFDNLYMDGNNPDDWTDSDPTKGIEGGTELLSLATKLNDPSYRPNKEKKAADTYFLDQMTFRQKVESDKQLIDKKALEAHYGKPFEDVTGELLKDVIADLDTKVDGFLKQKRKGTINPTHARDLGKAVGSLKKLNALKDSVDNDNYVIGSKSTAPADFMTAAEKREASPNKRTTKAFKDSQGQFQKRQEILRNEDAFYIGVTKLKNGQFVDKNIQKIQESRASVKKKGVATPVAPAPAPAVDPTTARLRALAQNDMQDAQQDLRDVAQYELDESIKALATANGLRSTKSGNTVANKQDSLDKYAEFDDKLDQVLNLDPEYRAVMDNPDLTVRERGARINAIYMSHYSKLREVTAEERGKSVFDRGARFFKRHSFALKVGAVVFGGAATILSGGTAGLAVVAGVAALSKGSDTHVKSLDALKSADTGKAGSMSFLNRAESLGAVYNEIDEQENSIGPVDMKAIARAASRNLREQYEQSLASYRQEHSKLAKKSLASAAIRGGVVFAGGYFGATGLDYAWNGDGGFMDKLNHLDDPNGATPWRPSADKPWWLSATTGYVGLAAFGSMAAYTAYRKAKNKTGRRQSDYGLAA